ncbi:MAG: hypothetical protein QXT77_08540, partial [Candidatus Methanomethylicaceae archaeon]
YVVLPNGKQAAIPRYYTDWLKKNQPEAWFRYVTEVQPRIMALAEEKERKEELRYLCQIMSYKGGAGYPRTPKKISEIILERKFKNLQEQLKL